MQNLQVVWLQLRIGGRLFKPAIGGVVLGAEVCAQGDRFGGKTCHGDYSPKMKKHDQLTISRTMMTSQISIVVFSRLVGQKRPFAGVGVMRVTHRCQALSGGVG